MMAAPQPENAMLTAAEYYISKGFRVFPLRKNLKTPATGNGFKDATLDPDQVRNWFGSDEGQNIGIATGGGLVVIDLDTKHGVDGLASLVALEATHGKLPETLTAATPSGGEHRLFKCPPALDIRNSAGKLGQGVDIRANGGYIAAAPSHTEASADPQGRTMTGDYRFTKKLPVADLPQAWLDLLTKGKGQPQPETRHYQRAENNDFQRLAEIQDALNYINPQPYDDWVKVGMALYSLGDNGLTLWDTWSRNASNYDPKEIPKRWKSFTGTSVGVESVFHLAQSAGWQNPAKGRKPAHDARVVPFPQHQHQTDAGEPPPHQSRQPEPLPSELPAVMKLNPAWLPEVIGDYVADAAEQMNAPPDFLAVTLLSGLATVIGRKIGIRPQENTDWTEVANMWGLLVGRPGMLKSPTMGVGLRPLYRLIARANDDNASARADWQAQNEVDRLKLEAAKAAYKKALAKDKSAVIDPAELRQNEEEPPPEKRYMTSDATVEALLEVLRSNDNGIMVFRDELVGLLKGMEREDRAEQRAMFLTGWNGNSPFTSDRIGRGLNLTVDAVCLSVLGATQPGKIAAYVRQAVKGGDGDDGLLQRFGLAVWPDVAEYVENDRPPDRARLAAVNALFDYLDTLKPQNVEAQQDSDQDGKPDGIPYLRFDSEALAIFRDWRTDLENELRSDDLHPALESHLAKYRKMVPGLALILHLSDRKTGSIGTIPLLQAINLAVYFRSHAERLYASVAMPEVKAAKTILKKLKSGEIQQPFSARDIYHRNLSGLDRETVNEALPMLVDYGYLEEIDESSLSRGRPVTRYVLTVGAAGDA